MIDNSIEIIDRNDKPYGIRNNTGYLFFFVEISRFSGQEERYITEIEEQRELANYLLDALKNKPK